jgi:hypothetical protein
VEVDLHRRVATVFILVRAKSSALVHGMARCGAKGSVRRRVGRAVGTRLLEAAHRHATGSVSAKMELALTMQPMGREGLQGESNDRLAFVDGMEAKGAGRLQAQSPGSLARDGVVANQGSPWH